MNKKFDPCGWVYGHRRADAVASDPVFKHLDPGDQSLLARSLMTGGGKAFGLELCKRIADFSDHLLVPSWRWIKISEVLQQDMGQYIRGISWIRDRNDLVLLRSSAHDEDWISPDSGAHPSHKVRVANLRGQLIESIHARIPLVLQQYVTGVGVVVDIAWSDLLGQVVVRISAGREFCPDVLREFSSATMDHEGPTLVLDTDGNVLVELQRGEVLVENPIVLPWADLAHELPCAVEQAIGSKFGVQLELIIHPDQPDVWHLVQIRPTPGRMQLSEVPNLTESTPIATSASISGAAYHQGKARILRPEENTWLISTWMHTSSDDEEIDVDEGFMNGTTIFVWEEQPHLDWGPMQMLMLYRMGAVGQITLDAITRNSSHSAIQRKIDNMKAEYALIHNCMLVALRAQQHEQLLDLLRARPRHLELVSDGLIAQIRLLD